jgi:hypothetical protein
MNRKSNTVYGTVFVYSWCQQVSEIDLSECRRSAQVQGRTGIKTLDVGRTLDVRVSASREYS